MKVREAQSIAVAWMSHRDQVRMTRMIGHRFGLIVGVVPARGDAGRAAGPLNQRDALAPADFGETRARLHTPLLDVCIEPRECRRNGSAHCPCAITGCVRNLP